MKDLPFKRRLLNWRLECYFHELVNFSLSFSTNLRLSGFVRFYKSLDVWCGSFEVSCRSLALITVNYQIILVNKFDLQDKS